MRTLADTPMLRRTGRSLRRHRITRCIDKMEREGLAFFHPRQETEDAWIAATADIHRQTLMNDGHKVNSWMMGANRDDEAPRVLIYFGGASAYYDALDKSADEGSPELAFSVSALRAFEQAACANDHDTIHGSA